MATYTFETITAAQAKAFDSQVDTLVFSNPTTTAATLRVNFSAASPVTQTTLTVLDVADNHQVLFGAGLENLRAVLPDGSMLLVAGAGGSELTGGPKGDGIFGTGGADTLHGGAGDDVIQGGGGADVLEGGPGSDLFLFAPGESPPTLSLMDRIIDWSPADRLTFVFANGMVTPSANATNYVELTAQSFSAAATMAQAQMAGGVVEYVSVQVGADVIVFTDIGFHSPQEAVMLQGRTLADIDASNIVSGVAAPQLALGIPSPPPPAAGGQTLTGTAGPDVLTGGPGNDQFHGMGGADTLTGGGGADTFIIGQNESPTSAAVGGHLDHLVRITDFSADDTLVFVGEPAATGGGTGNFIGVVPLVADFDHVLALADDLFVSRPGTVFIEAQIGTDLVIIDNQHEAVVLSNQTFQTFHSISIGDGGPPPPPPAEAHGVTAVISGGIDTGRLTNLLDNGEPSVATSTTISLQDGTSSMTLSGFGFTYDAAGELTGGTVTGIDLTEGSDLQAHITGLSLPVATLIGLAAQNDDSSPAVTLVFAGSDSIVANGAGFNSINGFAGDDTIQASGAENFLNGGAGDDSLSGALSGSNTLTGGSGADTIAGGDNPAGDHFLIDPGDSLAAAALGGHLGRLDHILNWNRQDILETRTLPADPQIYTEVTAASYDQAYAIALTNNHHGIFFTVAQVGADLVVFDPNADAIVISNRTLSDISIRNFSPSNEPPPVQASPGQTLVNGVLTGGALSEHFNTDDSVPEVHAGGGDDTIISATQHDVIRGDDGNDSIQGAAGFDDINGNKGNDTIDGGNGGSDWLLGGQGDDFITAHHDQNQIYGNLGNDTLHGGDGGDIIRGGQGDDVIVGGSGNDFISGDRGNDTESGGAGADIFHGSQDAGIDRVLDFHLSEGDRVQLDAGTTFAVSQVGADTVIDMGGGNQMILVGVQMSTLTGNWIFEG